jgi:hypothetical protein
VPPVEGGERLGVLLRCQQQLGVGRFVRHGSSLVPCPEHPPL